MFPYSWSWDIYLTPHLLTLRYKKRDVKFHKATLKHEAILGLAAKVECQTSYKQQKKKKGSFARIIRPYRNQYSCSSNIVRDRVVSHRYTWDEINKTEFYYSNSNWAFSN